jgi:hypothetical protein
MTREFCTYFDHRFLGRGLALYESLQRHCPDFRWWALCLDQSSYELLESLRLPNVRAISLDQLEAHDPRLLVAKNNRTILEYYFTCTPALVLFVLQHAPDVNLITYLDADLFFFSDVAPLYEEIGDSSIAIIEHRFPPSLRALESAGRFNVGWLSFRRDDDALACLRQWRDQCLEVCSERPEQGRYADQKYLDRWPDRFPQLAILQHKGANVAPWNLANHPVTLRRGRVFIDDEPLLFFHFHGLKERGRHVYDGSLGGYGVAPSRVIARDIYGAYIAELEGIAARLPLHRETQALIGDVRADLPRRTGRLRLWKDVLAGRYMVIWNGHVISAGR